MCQGRFVLRGPTDALIWLRFLWGEFPEGPVWLPVLDFVGDGHTVAVRLLDSVVCGYGVGLLLFLVGDLLDSAEQNSASLPFLGGMLQRKFKI